MGRGESLMEKFPFVGRKARDAAWFSKQVENVAQGAGEEWTWSENFMALTPKNDSSDVEDLPQWIDAIKTCYKNASNEERSRLRRLAVGLSAYALDQEFGETWDEFYSEYWDEASERIYQTADSPVQGNRSVSKEEALRVIANSLDTPVGEGDSKLLTDPVPALAGEAAHLAFHEILSGNDVREMSEVFKDAWINKVVLHRSFNAHEAVRTYLKEKQTFLASGDPQAALVVFRSLTPNYGDTNMWQENTLEEGLRAIYKLHLVREANSQDESQGVLDEEVEKLQRSEWMDGHDEGLIAYAAQMMSVDEERVAKSVQRALGELSQWENI